VYSDGQPWPAIYRATGKLYSYRIASLYPTCLFFSFFFIYTWILLCFLGKQLRCRFFFFCIHIYWCCSCRVHVCRCRGCCSLSVCVCELSVDLYIYIYIYIHELHCVSKVDNDGKPWHAIYQATGKLYSYRVFSLYCTFPFFFFFFLYTHGFRCVFRWTAEVPFLLLLLLHIYTLISLTVPPDPYSLDQPPSRSVPCACLLVSPLYMNRLYAWISLCFRRWTMTAIRGT